MKKNEIKPRMVLIDTVNGNIGVPCTHDDYTDKDGENQIYMMFKNNDLTYGLTPRPVLTPVGRLRIYDRPDVMMTEDYVRHVCNAGTNKVCGYISTITSLPLDVKDNNVSFSFRCSKVNDDLGGVWNDEKTTREIHPFDNHCGGRFGEWTIDKKLPEQKKLWERTLEEIRR